MRLSRETQYGLQGLVFLARQEPGAVIQLADIAAAQRMSPAFLSKIFQNLSRHGLIRSHRGRLRGYSLGRPAGEISLREILHATEGPDLLDRCAFWHDTCRGEENPCVLHKAWNKSRALLQGEVEALSLADLTRQWDPATLSPPHPIVPDMEVNQWKSGRRPERSS